MFMAQDIRALAAFAVLLLLCRHSSAQGGCSPAPPGTLIGGGPGTLRSNNVPNILPPNQFVPDATWRTVVGGHGTDPWAVFSETQVRQHGLWCQVQESQTNNMADNNVGDWYYPTPSGLTELNNISNDGTPYQELKCDNQVGLVVDGDIMNNQGIVRCTTNITDLTTLAGVSTNVNYLGVYEDSVITAIRNSGPVVESTMTLTLLHARDMGGSNVNFSLSFNVSLGLPSRVTCTRDGTTIHSGRGFVLGVNYEVVRPLYVSTSQPEITRVSFEELTRPRMEATYSCTVYVEGRINIAPTTGYDFDMLSDAVSNVAVTVAGTPTDVTVTRSGFYNSVLVSWTAPSPAPAGYEVFHQTTSDADRLSVGNTTSTMMTVTGLKLGVNYYIFAVSFGAEGTPVLPSVHSMAAQITLPTQLPPFSGTPTLTPTTTSIMASWNHPQYFPDSYTVSYSCQLLCDSQTSSVLTNTVTGSNNMYTNSSLNAGSSCTVSVTAVFGVVNGNTITSSTITLTAAPTCAPGGLTNTSVESRSLSIDWGTVPCPDQGGPITGYRLRYSNGTSIVNTTGEGSRQHVLTGLTPFTSYSVQVAAVNDGGSGPYSDPALTVETLQDVPGPVSSLSATKTVTQLTVSWSPPSVTNGVIIVYELLLSGNGTSNSTINSTTISLTLTYLPPNTTFTFSVRAYTIIGPGEYVTGQATTDPAPIVIPSSTPIPTQRASSSAAGPAAAVVVLLVIAVVVVIVIVVVVLYLRRRKEKPSSQAAAIHYTKEPLKKEDKSIANQNEDLYTAVANKPYFEQFPQDKTVLEGKKVVLPVKIDSNPPATLTWYHDNTRLNNDYAHEISSNGSLTIMTAEMSHTGTYRLVATNSEGTAESQLSLKVVAEAQKGPPKPPPPKPVPFQGKAGIPVSLFGQYVSQNHANTNKGFTTLYNALDSGEGEHPVTIAVTPANKPLNRFNNITVYDDNRIILQPISGSSDCQRDYINASYVDGYNMSHKYIASQGPLNKTLVDFWRMVWQERTPTIVMVTNLKENNKIKCQQYWPESGSKSFGPFMVTMTDQQVFADFTIRLLQVEFLGSSEYPREVTQYQFTSWPDHGVPEYATSILAYHRRIKKDHKPSRGPMVVHCSAGVGRTGTFIAIDTILEQVEKERVVDVSGVITKMRHKRMKMVQTSNQFTFIHDVILESVTCGDTQINSADLRPSIQKMSNRDPQTGRTGFELQFETLAQVTPKPTEAKMQVAKQHMNKNRSSNFLPPDQHRVQLKGVLPDYIHATFVNGYKHKKAFIVAQNPMESTIKDFWMMVRERDCRVVVMLCGPKEMNVCHQYWPNVQGRVEKIDDIGVELMQENKYGDFVERALTITDQSGKPHQLTQFQIQNWDPQGRCSNPQAITAVVEEVFKVQRRTDNKPIVVHCSDTVSRSGMFCAIATTIDRCKTESVVDVFQVVKAQRIQKPGLVLTVEQYQFVFEAVLTFLESFETYSNFK